MRTSYVPGNGELDRSIDDGTETFAGIEPTP